jgi:hypothetical protein
MEDVKVKVNGIRCELTLVSPKARRWGKLNFNSEDRLFIDLWLCANYVRAIHAEGLSVTPGTLDRIARAKSLFPRSISPVPPRHRAYSMGAEMKVVSTFSTMLISVMMSVRLWHVLELLLTDIRDWWTI